MEILNQGQDSLNLLSDYEQQIENQYNLLMPNNDSLKMQR
jgi:hypothetical protein